MESPGYTTQFLERLGTDELVKLGEEHGLDIPADLERIFIIEELLYLSRTGIGKGEETEEVLTKQQNISMVEVLVRDPLWAFVFWDIRGHDKERYESDEDFSGYYLRAVPLKDENGQPDLAASFIVTVGKNDSAWYLGFPPDDRRFYKVEICVPNWEDYTVLAVSRPFRMPPLIKPGYEQDEIGRAHV